MKRELRAAGGDDREGEVGQDVEELLPQGILGGHTAFVPGDPCGGFGVEIIGGSVIPGVPAVEGGMTDGGEVGDFVCKSQMGDEAAEMVKLVIGEGGIEAFSGVLRGRGHGGRGWGSGRTQYVIRKTYGGVCGREDGPECGAEVPAFGIGFGVQLLPLKYIFILLTTNIVHKSIPRSTFMDGRECAGFFLVTWVR